MLSRAAQCLIHPEYFLGDMSDNFDHYKTTGARIVTWGVTIGAPGEQQR